MAKQRPGWTTIAITDGTRALIKKVEGGLSAQDGKDHDANDAILFLINRHRTLVDVEKGRARA